MRAMKATETEENSTANEVEVERLVRRFGLDRRKRYAIWDGMLCTKEKATRPCTGCSCCGEYPCDCCAERGMGCEECGYTGKRVDHWPAPVLHAGRIIQANRQVDASEPSEDCVQRG